MGRPNPLLLIVSDRVVCIVLALSNDDDDIAPWMLTDPFVSAYIIISYTLMLSMLPIVYNSYCDLDCDMNVS